MVDCNSLENCRRFAAPVSSNLTASSNAGIAQLVEQLPCKHQVVGSIPAASTIT